MGELFQVTSTFIYLNGACRDSGRALSTVPTHVAAPSFHPHHATNVRPPV